MRPALRFDGGGGRGGGGGIGQGGNKPFAGPNPPYGAAITYYLKEHGPAKVEVLDAAGKVVRDLGTDAAGCGAEPRRSGICATRVRTRGAMSGDGRRRRRRRRRFGFPARGPLVLPGQVHGAADGGRQDADRASWK